jgi:hypothetical protein
MKQILLSLAVIMCAAMASAQGTLQFNQVKKIGSSSETVPSGKVWKVTSVYGSENACVNYGYNPQNVNYTYKKMIETAFYVDGAKIISASVDISSRRLCTSGCGSCDSGWSDASVFNATQPSDPNVLPLWLAAGSTLASAGANTFVSVIEFNVVP